MCQEEWEMRKLDNNTAFFLSERNLLMRVRRCRRRNGRAGLPGGGRRPASTWPGPAGSSSRMKTTTSLVCAAFMRAHFYFCILLRIFSFPRNHGRLANVGV
jgi:hypothetical protein